MKSIGRVPDHVYRGRPTSVAELAKMAGVGRCTMVRRLLILTPEEAVNLGPVNKLADRRAATELVPRRRYTYQGQPITIEELATMAGCSRDAMKSRLDYGHSPEDAVAAGARMRPTHCWNGRPITAAGLAAMAGCSTDAMTLRLGRRGYTPEQAVAMGPSGKTTD